MTEPQFLRCEILVSRPSNGNRRWRRRSDDMKRRREHGVVHRVGTCDHLALDENHCLETDACRRSTNVCGAPIRIKRYLDDSGAIAQIDECETAEIAAA